MFSQADMDAVIGQLKAAIVAGKFTCHRCHIPLGGAAVTQIDLFNGRVVYKCTNEACDNHNRSGYRTLRALNIDVPGMKAPADLTSVAAPAPPRAEEVSWSDGSETTILDVPSASPASAPAPAPASTAAPAPASTPNQSPKPAPQRQDIASNPDSEE